MKEGLKSQKAASATDDATVRRVSLLVGFGHGITHLYQMVLPPLYPILRQELALSYTQLGMVTTGMAISFAASQIIAGPLSDRIGRKYLLMAGHFLFAAAIAACGLVSTFWPLLFLQLLGGIGGSVFHPVGVALLTDVVPVDKRGKAMGIHGAGAMFGTALAPVTMVYLTVLFNWRFAMIVAGLLGIVSLPLLAAYLVEPSRAVKAEPGGSEAGGDRAYPFATLALLILLMIWTTRAVANRAYQAFLPTFLVSRYDLGLELSGVFATIYWIFAAFAMMLGGYLADRYHRYLLLWITSIMAMISLAVMLVATPDIGNIIYLNLFLLGMFTFMGAPAFFSIYSEGMSKARSGAFYSLGFTVAFGISSVVPGAMGWITDRFNAAVSFYPALALLAITVAIIPVLWRMRAPLGYQGDVPRGIEKYESDPV